jgi:hypothetical protein
MSRILTLLLALLFSVFVNGQGTSLPLKISVEDSIKLNDFWTSFKKAVNKKNKMELAALCRFPFFCWPCIVDTTLEPNNGITIHVTKTLFFKSQYRLFFDKPIVDVINKYSNFEIDIFSQDFDNRSKPKGFMFPYTIIAPSKTWEGLQGFIYLDKIDNKYKITGIDTVP